MRLRGLADLPWRLVVGDGPARAAGRERSSAPRRTRCFLGTLEPRAMLRDVYAACDLYAWPAVNEAYGMALLEAQAAGLPVVAAPTARRARRGRRRRTGLLVRRERRCRRRRLRALLDRPRAARALGREAAAFVAQPSAASTRLAQRLGNASRRAMTLLALLRHGATAWSAAGRLQGRTDVPLSAAARGVVTDLLPDSCRRHALVTSPLQRCVQTAALLGAPDAAREPRIIEMHLGRLGGRIPRRLRAGFGEAMRENEARGLDFRPAAARARAKSGAGSTAGCATSRARPPTLAVTHNGVIRALFAAGDRLGHARQAAGEARLGRGASLRAG